MVQGSCHKAGSCLDMLPEIQLTKSIFEGQIEIPILVYNWIHSNLQVSNLFICQADVTSPFIPSKTPSGWPPRNLSGLLSYSSGLSQRVLMSMPSVSIRASTNFLILSHTKYQWINTYCFWLPIPLEFTASIVISWPTDIFYVWYRCSTLRNGIIKHLLERPISHMLLG